MGAKHEQIRSNPKPGPGPSILAGHGHWGTGLLWADLAHVSPGHHGRHGLNSQTLKRGPMGPFFFALALAYPSPYQGRYGALSGLPGHAALARNP